MRREELRLGLARVRDGLALVDVELRRLTTRCTRDAGLLRSADEDIARIGALVHEIKLGEHPDRACTIGVDALREGDGVRVGEIRVGARDREDDALGLAHKAENHLLDLRGDVGRLVADGHLRRSGKIDQGEVEHVGLVHRENDRLVVHAEVAATLALGVGLNLAANLVEIVPALAGLVGKLGVAAVRVMELQDERAASDNPRAARQE